MSDFTPARRGPAQQQATTAFGTTPSRTLAANDTPSSYWDRVRRGASDAIGAISATASALVSPGTPRETGPVVAVQSPRVPADQQQSGIDASINAAAPESSSGLSASPRRSSRVPQLALTPLAMPSRPSTQQQPPARQTAGFPSTPLPSAVSLQQPQQPMGVAAAPAGPTHVTYNFFYMQGGGVPQQQLFAQPSYMPAAINASRRGSAQHSPNVTGIARPVDASAVNGSLHNATFAGLSAITSAGGDASVWEPNLSFGESGIRLNRSASVAGLGAARKSARDEEPSMIQPPAAKQGPRRERQAAVTFVSEVPDVEVVPESTVAAGKAPNPFGKPPVAPAVSTPKAAQETPSTATAPVTNNTSKAPAGNPFAAKSTGGASFGTKSPTPASEAGKAPTAAPANPFGTKAPAPAAAAPPAAAPKVPGGFGKPGPAAVFIDDDGFASNAGSDDEGGDDKKSAAPAAAPAASAPAKNPFAGAATSSLPFGAKPTPSAAAPSKAPAGGNPFAAKSPVPATAPVANVAPKAAGGFGKPGPAAVSFEDDGFASNAGSDDEGDDGKKSSSAPPTSSAPAKNPFGGPANPFGTKAPPAAAAAPSTTPASNPFAAKPASATVSAPANPFGTKAPATAAAPSKAPGGFGKAGPAAVVFDDDGFASNAGSDEEGGDDKKAAVAAAAAPAVSALAKNPFAAAGGAAPSNPFAAPSAKSPTPASEASKAPTAAPANPFGTKAPAAAAAAPPAAASKALGGFGKPGPAAVFIDDDGFASNAGSDHEGGDDKKSAAPASAPAASAPAKNPFAGAATSSLPFGAKPTSSAAAPSKAPAGGNPFAAKSPVPAAAEVKASSASVDAPKLASNPFGMKTSSAQPAIPSDAKPAAAAVSTGGSVFGAKPAAAPGAPSNPFGNAKSPTAPGGNPFGSPVSKTPVTAAGTTANPFGAATTTAPGASPFGTSVASNPFGQKK